MAAPLTRPNPAIMSTELNSPLACGRLNSAAADAIRWQRQGPETGALRRYPNRTRRARITTIWGLIGADGLRETIEVVLVR